MTLRRLALLLLGAMLLGPAAGRAEPPLVVGALLAVTGPASFLGAPEARSLELLVADLNAKGGIAGRQVKLVVKDTGASPEKAVSMARQLIDEEQAFAIIGPSTSGESMAVKPIAQEAKVLLLSCAAAEAIVNPVASWVFKTAQKDSDAIAQVFAAMKRQKVTRIGLLSSNTGFGKAGKDQVEKLAPTAGITVVTSEVYDKAATDLSAEVTKLNAAKVEAILNWSIEPAQSIVIKNARQLGFKGPIFQSHGFGNLQYAKAAGAAAEGVIFPASRVLVAEEVPASHPQKTVLVAYKKAYEGKYGEPASAFGGYAYDALLLLAHAAKAGGADPARTRAALEATHGFVGVSGVFNFSPADHNGLGMDAFELLTVKDGVFSIVAR
jgi:branched-chain amino acid transport system substrate-binding protein